MPGSSTDRSRKEERRWRVPPPVLRDPDSSGPEGMIVLREVPSGLGTLLWISLRNVVTWAGVEEEARAGLFDAGAFERRLASIEAASPERMLEEPLREIATLLQKPESVEAETIMLACSRVAQWARDRDAVRTSVEFYQAGALACPEDPRAALAVGMAARECSLYPRAESWFQRTIGLSRRTQDWDSYARTYVALGKMMIQRGALPVARRHLIKALRRSLRQGFTELEAIASHDLFTVEYACGNLAQAQKYAARALGLYGPGHRMLPVLARDTAFFWLQRSLTEEALPVLRAALPALPAIHQPATIASIARASGRSGNSGGVCWAIEELVRRPAAPGMAEAWVEVGWAARAVGLEDDATRAGERAASVAADQGEWRAGALAEALLASANGADGRLSPQPGSSAGVKTADPVAAELARDLVRSLAAR